MSPATFDPVLSVFPSAIDADTMADTPLSAVLARIRSPELEQATVRIRGAFALTGKKGIDAAKKRLPAVTLAGAFDRRSNAAWRIPSDLVQFDLDSLGAAELEQARAALVACPWVVCLWRSPSGAGLKGAVRVPALPCDPGSYTQAWQAVTRWLASVGLLNDPAAKDVSRLAFLAHDPEAYHNPQAIALDTGRWTEAQPIIVAPAVPDLSSRTDAGKRALAYVRAMPASVEGANGSAALVAVVRAVRDGFDLSGSDLWHVLETWNGERASPPWSRAELEHALASVEKVPPQHPRGWLLASEAAPSRAEAAWPKLEPLRGSSEPPPFDLISMLPADLPQLADMVDATAEALQVPKEMVASIGIGLAAVAASRSVEVVCMSGWDEPAPLWMLPLMRPGEKKSGSMSLLARPFHAWMADERQAMAEPLARYMERRRIMEARLAAVRGEAAKCKDRSKRATLEQEASDLAADLDALPARMAAPDLLVQSVTPEGLRDALEANGEKAGIVSAEADAAELMGCRYSDAGPSIDLLLSAHAGDEYTTRRAGGRCVPLSRPAVGMVLCVQPDAVQSVLADRVAKGRGLIDRMLLILPPSRMGSRHLEPPPVSAAVAGWWASAIRGVLDLPWPGRVIIGHDGEPMRCTSAPRLLPIDAEARRILWRLRADLEPRLAEGADLAAMSGFASKLPGACARIALAFTVLRDPQADTVGAEAMRAACAWAPFLLAHRRAVLGEAAEKPEARHARRLWRALQRRGHASMTSRDLFRLIEDSAMPSMDEFRPVLDILAEHGAIRPATEVAGRAGRPAERWEVHPSLLPSPPESDKTDTMADGEGVSSDMSDFSLGRKAC